MHDANIQIKDNMAIYPKETFCCHNKLDDNVYTEHCMLASWKGETNGKEV